MQASNARTSNVTTTRMLAMACSVIALYASACSTTAVTPRPGAPAAALPAEQNAAQQHKGDDTLYEALGGAEGVELLADNFVIELAADDRVRHRFVKSDIGRFHRLIQLQICEVSDGPCVYTGDNMKLTHGGMNIQSYEFNAVVEALMRAMDSSGLNPGVQNRLLAIFASMRADIVGQ